MSTEAETDTDIETETETEADIRPYAYDPSTFDHAAYHGFSPPPGCTRHEGWTPDKQRRFLEALSEGINVFRSCDIVGMSKQSAYALRSSPRGQAFALGWQAALLKARDALADELMDRAFNGVRESGVNGDGSVVTRHRHDNRLAASMLARLDRMADAPTTTTAARLVAADFSQYLDLIERDAGPARTGVFLGARIEPAGDEDLAPIRALARADRWLRTNTDSADPIDTADLDPAERGAWTAAQWVRAEAAGLVELAPEKPPASQASQAADLRNPDNPDGEPVWWSTVFDRWTTRFPPPPYFYGEEEGDYGDPEYSRELSEDELDVIEAHQHVGTEARRLVEDEERDRWFAAIADDAAADDADEAAEEEEEEEDDAAEEAACLTAPSESPPPAAAPAPAAASRSASRAARRSAAAAGRKSAPG